MTINPTEATMAVLGTGPDLSGSSAPSGAADFLAAILQALAPGTPGATGPAAAAGADTDAASGPAAPDAGAQATDAAALGLVPTIPALAAAVPGLPAVVPGRANVAAGAVGAPTDTTSDIRTPGDEAATAPDPAAAASTTPSDQQPGQHADQTVQSTSQQAPAPTAVPTVTPSTATTHAPPTHVTAHVTGQVFPEVTSLAARGDGTHRITLSLKPEALGEVRVVMTVRDGVVHVRLAAGHEAQRALLDGSSELTRLLEATGASETRIVVRDLGSTAATAGAGTDLSSGLGDQQTTQDQHAGTRAQHPATDGTNDTRASRGTTGANPPRSVEPVTRTRTAGVDVTM